MHSLSKFSFHYASWKGSKISCSPQLVIVKCVSIERTLALLETSKVFPWKMDPVLGKRKPLFNRHASSNSPSSFVSGAEAENYYEGGQCKKIEHQIC
jgi:hypothetical protein